MAKVRARRETGMLYLDFFYRGVRCREQTALHDTSANRRRVQTLMNRVEREIKTGVFDYAATFPNSARAAQFAEPKAGNAAPAAAFPDGNVVLPPTPLFSEFSVTWRAEMAPQWRRLHHRSVDTIFETHLLPAFGKMPIAAISKPDVLEFRAKLAALPGRGNVTLASTTINKIVGILRQCLTEATERHDLPDVFKGVRRLRARRTDVQPFTLDEVERIRSTIRSDYRNYITVRFFTGLRTGEINGLKWKYVDFDNDLILIRETYSAGRSEENAKTLSSLRDIAMLPMVKEALRDEWELRDPDSEFVFATRGGGPIDANNFTTRIWYPLLRHLGIAKRRPYETRHTTATLMLAAGENPEWIARLMGHTNTQMLFTVYSRFVPNLTRQDGQAFIGMVHSKQAPEAAADPPSLPAALQSLTPEQLDALLALARQSSVR